MEQHVLKIINNHLNIKFYFNLETSGGQSFYPCINLVNLSFCQLATLPNCHFINMPFCQLVALLIHHFINLPFHQNIICQLVFMLMRYFNNMSIFSTCGLLTKLNHTLW